VFSPRSLNVGHVEEVCVQELRDVCKAGAGASGGSSGTDQRQLFASVWCDGVQRKVPRGFQRYRRWRRNRKNNHRPRLIRGL